MAVDVVTVEAAYLAMIHIALYKVVTLHAVLVCGKIGKLVEIGNAVA